MTYGQPPVVPTLWARVAGRTARQKRSWFGVTRDHDRHQVSPRGVWQPRAAFVRGTEDKLALNQLAKAWVNFGPGIHTRKSLRRQAGVTAAWALATRKDGHEGRPCSGGNNPP